MDNEQIIRKAYQIAEDKDSEGWLAAFTPDGTFTDESIGVTYRGRDRAFPLENYGRAFSDTHRELYRLYVNGDIVVVQLALQGTHDGRWNLCRQPRQPQAPRLGCRRFTTWTCARWLGRTRGPRPPAHHVQPPGNRGVGRDYPRSLPILADREARAPGAGVFARGDRRLIGLACGTQRASCDGSRPAAENFFTPVTPAAVAKLAR